MSALLACEKVSVRFGGVTALREVSLDVHPGEVVGVIGPNGAGKSTLFNAISGFVVYSGTISVLETPVDGLPPGRRATLGFSRTFQHGRLCDGMPVWENLLLAAHHEIAGGMVASALRLPRSRAGERAARARALELARTWAIEHALEAMPADLPFGVQRRVEVARALMARPRLLLLDEPASGLDSEESNDLAREIAALPERDGVAVLLIEHDMDVVQKACDRLSVIDFGTVVFQGDPSAALCDPKVQEAYLGEGIVRAAG